MVKQQIPLFFAFIAGLLSFLSPCVLPLIPAYISFITGISIQELTVTDQQIKIFRKVLFDVCFFVSGFSIIFILLGASATFLGRFILVNQRLLQIIGGAVVIILGGHIAGIFNLEYLQYEKKISLKARLSQRSQVVTMLGSFMVGVVFALAWTPCVGPILAAILVLAGTQKTVYQGIALLTAYSLGLAVPFLITSLAINTFLGFFKKIIKYSKLIVLISGLLLIIIGVLIMTNNFNFLYRVF